VFGFVDIFNLEKAGGFELFGMRGEVEASDLGRLVPDSKKVPILMIDYIHASNPYFSKLHLDEQTLLLHIDKQQLIGIQLDGQDIFQPEILNCD
jgi:hypothetical protein